MPINNVLSYKILESDTVLISEDNEAARRRRIVHTLKKLTTQPTKLAKESEVV